MASCSAAPQRNPKSASSRRASSTTPALPYTLGACAVGPIAIQTEKLDIVPGSAILVDSCAFDDNKAKQGEAVVEVLTDAGTVDRQSIRNGSRTDTTDTTVVLTNSSFQRNVMETIVRLRVLGGVEPKVPWVPNGKLWAIHNYRIQVTLSHNAFGTNRAAVVVDASGRSRVEVGITVFRRSSIGDALCEFVRRSLIVV